MRGYEIVRRRRAGVMSVLSVTAAGVLLAFASPALAGKVGVVRGSWSMSKIEQGAGEVPVLHGRIPSPPFTRTIQLGDTPFNFNQVPVPGFAVDKFDETGNAYFLQADAPSIAGIRPLEVKGGHTHEESSVAFEKTSHEGTLRFQLSNLDLDMTDDDGPLLPSECQAPPCFPIQTTVRYQARAWTVAGGHVFFDSGGTLVAQGHDQEWFGSEATASDAQAPFWSDAQFSMAKSDGASSFHIGLKRPLNVDVPLKRLHLGTLFMTKVSIDVKAIDDRGGESGASSFAVDPPHVGPGVVARGLTPGRVQNLKEPPLAPRPAARCANGPRPHAGTVQLSSRPLTAGEGSGTALVLVTRKGGSSGATSVIVKTSGGTALSGADFKPTRTLVRFENGESSPRLVEVPIREDLQAETPESFKVSLAHVRCAKLGKQRSASVTILDDDQPLPPPTPEFTIGGTVDGLQGSGLVLTNLGTALPVSANGSFTFPGTASDGQNYRVNVNTQPHNPDQVCTVQNGVGQVSNANVTNITVHCQTTVIPSGLDTTFGSNGHVTTPGNGDGRAVLIQPDGHIIVVGRRAVGNQGDLQFGAAGYDAAGNLDSGFGTNGIATTDLPGFADEANDAAMFPDGGFVTVGQADPAGLANIDFGLVRYTPDGHLDPTFGTGGVVTSDLTGHDDSANAVVVQPDGKIVVAGIAQTAPGNSDLGLARYNPDGTLDSSFGHGGIVTTDLGTFDDSIADIALQPDGKIVAVGAVFESAALARYLPDGRLDPTFGNAGTVIGGLGLDQFNGIAVTPGGTILLAGGGGGDAIIASYGPTGKLNLGFGTLGVAQADLSAGSSGDDLVVKADGDIVLVGTADTATGDMALVRFKPDGTVAASLTADVSGFSDFGHALAIDAQGRIVAAGTAGGQFGLLRANL